MGLSWRQGPLAVTRGRPPALGRTSWFTARSGQRDVRRAAWQFRCRNTPPILEGRIALPWRAMVAFYEEDERILGPAADPYHRVDIRSKSRCLVVYEGRRLIAATRRPVVLYESGFAPRWYVDRRDVGESALQPVDGQTFCPYKGLASYYGIGERRRAAWSYTNAWAEAEQVRNMVSFEPDDVDVYLDHHQLRLESGQTVIADGLDRALDADELLDASVRPNVTAPERK
jgi:uncharacterized protein (DUF427 family)